MGEKKKKKEELDKNSGGFGERTKKGGPFQKILP